MSTKLKQYFPMLWERSELLDEIKSRKELLSVYEKWTFENQQQFLNFCTGVSGIKFLYDGFFKEQNSESKKGFLKLVFLLRSM